MITNYLHKYRAVSIGVIICFVFAAGLGPDAAMGAAARRDGSEPQNIAFDFLDMEKSFGAGPSHFERISGLIAKAKERLPLRSAYTRDEALAVLKSIDSLLKGEGFVFKDNFLLCKGLDKKTIDCDNYCAIYTAIAEVLKIPIVPVYAPNHSFVRFYLDDGVYVNWETTKSATYDDNYYIRILKVSDVSLKKGVYLKTLGRNEFIGVEFNNIGAYLMSSKKFVEAVPYFNSALRYYSKFSSAYHNRGTAFYALKRTRNALDDLLAARDLDPNRTSTRLTLGDVYLDLKEYARAEEEYMAAINLDPANYIPYNNLALIMKETGRDEESRRWFKKSLEVKARKR
jgi:tetratricopeptide (TPR) repeat protein